MIEMWQTGTLSKLMKTITKKIYPEWFDLVNSGKKKYELRLDEFDIEEGDTLRLEEYTEKDKKPTGRFIEKKVNYVRKVDLAGWLKQQPELLKKGLYVIQFD